MAKFQMNAEQFIDEIILPEAARIGIEVEADLHKKRGDVCQFVILYKVTGEKPRRITPVLVNMNDIARDADSVRGVLSGIKQIIDSDGLVTPDGWRTFKGKP